MHDHLNPSLSLQLPFSLFLHQLSFCVASFHLTYYCDSWARGKVLLCAIMQYRCYHTYLFASFNTYLHKLMRLEHKA